MYVVAPLARLVEVLDLCSACQTLQLDVMLYLSMTQYVLVSCACAGCQGGSRYGAGR